MAAFDFPATPTNGQIFDTGTGLKYIWNATDSVWNVYAVPQSSTFLTNIVRTVIAVAGAGAYVPPAGLKFLEVELVGTGGNGGVAAATTAGQSSAGSGGGGGGYCRKLYKASDLAASEPYVIGARAGGSGGNGGDSTFKGLTAGGGGGGGTIAAGTGLIAQAASGVGGTATGGDLNVAGGPGMGGMRGAHNNASVAQKGFGGGSHMAPPRLSTPVTTGASPGEDGIFPGGGGVGGCNGASAATSSGGFGAFGCLILTEYF